MLCIQLVTAPTIEAIDMDVPPYSGQRQRQLSRCSQPSLDDVGRLTEDQALHQRCWKTPLVVSGLDLLRREALWLIFLAVTTEVQHKHLFLQEFSPGDIRLFRMNWD